MGGTMTDKVFCYQCEKLKSKDQLLGKDMDFGRGSCRPERWLYQYPKYLQPVDSVVDGPNSTKLPCPYFKKRSPVEIEKIEKWMEKNGITAYVRSMA